MYSTRHSLPNPDEATTQILDNGKQIATQGYAGKNVLETITYSTEGTDPKDGTYYSYYLTRDKKYFQLMAFLEEEENLNSTAFTQKSGQTHRSAPTEKNVGVNLCVHPAGCNIAKALDYSTRYPKVFGKKLGILVDSNNTPIQELTGSLDISDVGDLELKSYLKDYDYLSGTGTTFQPLATFAKVGGKFCSTGNLECIDPNNEPGWTQIIKVNSTISDLAKFGDTSEIESTFYTDSTKGIGWGTNDNVWKNFIINKNYSQILIIFSGEYDNPSGGLGWLQIDNEEEDSDSRKILNFSDAWANAGQGQSLYISGNTIYEEEQIVEVNREELINYSGSSLLKISMKGYESGDPYVNRYIKELWIK